MLPSFALRAAARVVTREGHRLACPIFQPRGSVSASCNANSRTNENCSEPTANRDAPAPKNDFAIHDSAKPRCAATPASFTVGTTMLPSFALRAAARVVTREGHRLACPIFQPRSGVSAHL